MRPIIALLLLASLSSAQEDVAITRHLNLDYSVTCPGNVLHMNATSSDGTPVAGVEIRLVLYVPYQGLRGLAHTDSDGHSSIELGKNGSYRIYLYNTTLDHDKYVEFEYPRMCPPPPPKQMSVSVSADCEALRLNIEVTKNDTSEPLEDVFITAGNWSSYTGAGGTASLPFEKDYVYVTAERGNYSSQGFYFDARCLPPPECLDDYGCEDAEFCNAGGDCESVTGACGHPANHTWVAYGCCADADCGNESLECRNNTCMPKPLPPEPPTSNITSTTNATNIANQTNATGNESGPGEEAPPGACAGAFVVAACLIFSIRISGLPGWP